MPRSRAEVFDLGAEIFTSFLMPIGAAMQREDMGIPISAGLPPLHRPQASD